MYRAAADIRYTQTHIYCFVCLPKEGPAHAGGPLIYIGTRWCPCVRLFEALATMPDGGMVYSFEKMRKLQYTQPTANKHAVGLYSSHAWINAWRGYSPHEKRWSTRLGTPRSLLLGAQTSKPFSWCCPLPLLGSPGGAQLRSYNQN